MNLNGKSLNHLEERAKLDVLGRYDDVAFFLLRDNLKVVLVTQNIKIEAWINLKKYRNTFGNNGKVLALSLCLPSLPVAR